MMPHTVDYWWTSTFGGTYCLRFQGRVATLRVEVIIFLPNVGTLLQGSLAFYLFDEFNRLTPNDPYMGRPATLTSKRCILYIYSTNIGTDYFKYALYPPFLSLQNAVCFIMLTCLVPVLFTFYIQGVLKLKK